MSLKTVLEKLLKGQDVNDLARLQNLCPAGLHPRDSNWQDGLPCMYCDADRKRRTKTAMMAGAEGGEAPAGAPAAVPNRRGGTRIIDPEPGLEPGGQPAQGRRERRRIVGVMASYTWRPEGELFAIRTGKNEIGAGVAGEPDPDILITSDPTMSGEHAIVLYQGGTCYLHDLMSANGTWLQGKRMTPGSTQELVNYASIKTGSTVWTFIQIHPGGDARAEPVLPDETAEEPAAAPAVEDDVEFRPEPPRKPRTPGGTRIN